MPRYLPCLVFLALGCTDGTAPVLGPCPAATASFSDLCGTWAAEGLVTGSSLILNIRLHDDTISGTGTYSIEAGRSGVLRLAGGYDPPNITLTLRYDYGYVANFSGTVTGARQITGTLSDASGHAAPLTLSSR